MSTQNKWYVLTGGPAVGKTTLLAALQQQGYAVTPEAARAVIDDGLAAGRTVAEIRSDEKAFQEEVTRRKIALEAELPAAQLTFFDRGMQDTHAYLHYYCFTVEDWVDAAGWQAQYQGVFLLEPLGTSFERDYARTEDDQFAEKIQQLLHDTYVHYGMEPVLVPALPVAERVQFIIDHLKQEQPA